MNKMEMMDMNKMDVTAELTEQQRRLVDAALELTPEELKFMIEVMKIVDSAPEKSDARADFAEQHARNYSLRTAEGRKSFLDALRSL